MNRRTFIRNILTAIIGLQLAALFFSFFRRSGRGETNDKQWLELGNVSDFKNGQTYSFPNNKLFLHRSTEGGFIALSNKCTHLGCAISLDTKAQQFICPCHASKFDQVGRVLQSPANRPLDYHPIQLHAGKIAVDLSRKIKRSAFEAAQLTAHP